MKTLQGASSYVLGQLSKHVFLHHLNENLKDVDHG